MRTKRSHQNTHLSPKLADIEGMSMLRVEEQLGQLSQTLWHQRNLVELLLYRLEIQQVVLTTKRTNWLNQASRDVEDVIIALRDEELLRAAQVAAVSAPLGVASDASLSELASAADEPWCQILQEHKSSFLTLISAIKSVSRDNRDLLNQGLENTRRFMTSTVETGAGNGRSSKGNDSWAAGLPTMVDWNEYNV